MNGRFVTYDHMDLFDGFQQQSHSNASKSHQSNGYHQVNGSNNGGPCSEDYDPTGLLDPLSTGHSYNSTTAAALNNAGVQQLAASMSRAPLQYGLFRPSAPCPNPALIQQQQQQQHNNMSVQQQAAQYQKQLQQQAAEQASLIAADFEPVPLPPSMQQQYDSQRRHHHSQHRNQHNHHRLPSNDSLIQMLPGAVQPQPTGSLFANDFEVSGVSSCSTEGSKGPEWLENLKIEVPGLSLEPMSGQEVVERLREKTNDVIARFLPCVDFLVACQQDLRKGLMCATQKRLVRRAYRDSMTPRQFHQKYIAPLPQRFLINNRHIMQTNYLRDAYEEIQKLSNQARSAERQGCDVVKNSFLGGMKDGESWGLRKWLSKHGGALCICTDLELILSACQKLDKELESTKKLAALMRPMAKNALDRLRHDVPQSYQEVSTAHPYLPFFHRLEAALRSVSNFDPEDDDVICLDDSDDEDAVQEVKPKATTKTPPPASSKRPPTEVNSTGKSLKRPRLEPIKLEPIARKDGDDSDSDDDSDIEIVGVKPAAGAVKQGDNEDWMCSGCSTNNDGDRSICNGCNMSRDFMNDLLKFPAFEDVMNVKTGLSDSEDDNDMEPDQFDFGFSTKKAASAFNSGDDSSFMAARFLDSNSASPASSRKGTGSRPHVDARKLAQDIESLADIFDIGQQSNIRPRNAPVPQGSFWDGERYASALRLFAQILRMPEAEQFLFSVDDRDMYPPYHSIIKNPLCFHDIVAALIPEDFSNLDFNTGRSGQLPPEGLHFWNMWTGQDLLQAIDLVMLNALAYGKIADDGRSSQRSETNRLRKVLWSGIQEILSRHVGTDKELQKQHQPTRRGETSGFVIHKSNNR